MLTAALIIASLAGFLAVLIHDHIRSAQLNVAYHEGYDDARHGDQPDASHLHGDDKLVEAYNAGYRSGQHMSTIHALRRRAA